MALAFLGRHLVDRPNLQRVLSNMGWLLGDKVLRLGVGLIVGVWIARYLGPEKFGLLNFATAFTALFGVLATLGLDGIVIRDLVKHPEERDILLGSAFGLKVLGSIVTLCITLTAVIFLRPTETMTWWLVGMGSAGFLFQSINVVDFYFQSQVKAKFTVCANNAAFALATLVRILLLAKQAPLIAFAWASLIEIGLASSFLALAYKRTGLNVTGWGFRVSVARRLLTDSWPLILSGLAIMVYMRIDQVMIGQMLGEYEVGIFSAAVRISEVWFFIPVAIATSVFPTILTTKADNEALYYQRLQQIFDVMALLGGCVAVVTTFASDRIIQLLYGAGYAASAEILALHIWAGIFFCLGVASSNWFMAENLQKYLFYRTLLGGVANVLLNLYMVPRYGAKGAAISTVISQGCASVFCNVLFDATRQIFICQIKAFFPYRLLVKRPASYLISNSKTA